MIAPKFDRFARFEEFDGHRSPVLCWQPRGGARAHAVFFPPFGDEMNQTRRMFRLMAEALAAHGVAARMFDLLGTGDSSADFSEATVTAWLADCSRMLTAAQDEHERLVLIGCRLGVALAVKASEMLANPAELLVGWAPLLHGSQQLHGLLRAARFAWGSRFGAPDPRACWAGGERAWLAGYPVSPTLAQQLDALETPNAPRVKRATLIELRNVTDESELDASEVMRRRAQAWNQAGVDTNAMALRGPAFWNVVDLVDVPQLLELTMAAVQVALDGAQSKDGRTVVEQE